jgi:hypothetical protein
MSTDEQLSCGELDNHRVVLRRCREAAEEAIREVMAHNAAVMARIDAASWVLRRCRPGEPSGRRRRQGQATELTAVSLFGGAAFG